jgi:GT2 family glycosyltransferase
METIEPSSIPASGLLEPDEDNGGDEPVQVVPPVVAVVVTNNPGVWLEETLAALAAQDYPALGVLVLDNASIDDPTPRVATAMPRAFIRRRADDDGFGAAANDALSAVEGATFLLFCHDDVALDPDAVRIMVEEAYRSNAGIVGPKIVDHDNPDILLEVGMAVDHYGVPFSGIEPDEVDQEQHDAVRDVFFVSHAAMLVRADLFRELSGFDPEAFPGADDVDLCWRARLAGARVIVAPGARVRHRRATLVEERPTHASTASDLGAATRSRVRVLYKSYSALALVWVLPVAFVLAAGEAVGLALTGRARRGWAVLTGWCRAFAHPRELRKARAATQQLRRVDDGDVRDLMVRGSARMRTFVTYRVHASDRFAEASLRTRARMDEASTQLRRAPAVIAMLLGLIVLVGSRSLLFGRVAAVGAFQTWPGIGAAWSTFSGSWRTTMMGAPTAATPAFALMAGIETGVLGHAGFARSLVIAGALPLGIWGTFRLVRPMAGSALPPVLAAVAYGVNPLPRNAIAHGALGPLVCFALAPFALNALVRVSANDAARRTQVHAGLALALLLAVAGAVWPPALLLACGMALAFVLAWPFSGESTVVLRACLGALVATVIAFVLLVPWSASLLGADAATRGSFPHVALSLGNVLRFHTGPSGAGLAPFGILVAASVPLFFSTGSRFAWAARAWILAALSFALAWMPPRVSPTAAHLSVDGVLVLAALGLAFAVGLGAAAILDDLPRFRFGWRHALSLIAGVALAWAALGLAADSVSGRYNLPTSDWASAYAWMNDKPTPGHFRVLYVGDPNVLPADAKVTRGIGFAMTRNGPGDARALWAAPEGHADRLVAAAITAAESGATSRLGHLLAPTGVRYVAFLTRAAPGEGQVGVPEPALAEALGRQLDLSLAGSDPSGVIYQNDAWIPMHAVTTTDTQTSTERADDRAFTGVPTSSGRTAPIGPGTLTWSEAANGRWHASAAGKTLPRRDAFGNWTNAFTLDANARVRVTYGGSATTALLRVLALLGWVIAFAVFLMTRRRAVANPRQATE